MHDCEYVYSMIDDVAECGDSNCDYQISRTKFDDLLLEVCEKTIVDFVVVVV